MTITKRVIITGGPGTGKSTLLNLLGKRGYYCHQEISRAVIRQQLDLGTNLLPWDNLPGFSHLVFEGQKEQYENAVQGQWNFYDRGMPDVLAYLRKENIHEKRLEELAQRFRYYPTVFLTPPWPAIYAMDDERREDLTAMQSIHDNLVGVYTDLGYEVMELPRISADERLQMIFNKLGIG
ncbi:MAG: AAA family ATPase [Owenweeksia sp.]